ncbi:MAG: ribbon-helix-helix protein, CopG family [Gammaproteobacteria bacterium]|nr:ribbon-helix-helix protein, CopG family [Gammaproteobacteria bacterium]
MDILLHLDNETAAQLDALARDHRRPRDALALEALQNWLAVCRARQWPREVLAFQGMPDMPTFESYRDELRVSR